MNDQLSKRDWETISAYLDGQISGRNLARFESRLTQEPRLQTALNELSATRQALRNAPRLRVPRNFTLTPEMVGQPRRKPRFAPFLGWATAVAGLLLVLVFAGDLISGSGMGTVAMEAPPEPMVQEVALEAAPMEASAAPVEAEPAVFDAPAAGGYSEVLPGTAETEASLEVAAAPEVEPTVDSEQIFSPAAAPTATPEPVPTDEMLGIAAETVTATMLLPASRAVITGTGAVTEGVAATPEAEITSEGAEASEGDSEPPAEEPSIEESAPPVVESTPPPTVPPPPPTAELPAPTAELPAPTAVSSVNAEPETITVQEQPAPAGAAEQAASSPLRGLEIALLLAVLVLGGAWAYLRHRGI